MILTENLVPKSRVWACVILLTAVGSMYSCQPAPDHTAGAVSTGAPEINPPAKGFDMANSDPEAIKIADQVMEAMGGRAAWDHTRYLAWNFFGSRKLVWDKQSGNVRVDFPDSTVYLFNINNGSGKVIKSGMVIDHPDSLAQELDKANRIWINDSYWLVMPFKLKDSGVTLKHLGMMEGLDGTSSEVLQLTFKQVGVTPQNKYLVYVDTSNHLVNQWAYYREADQDSANFVVSWENYKQYGDILLSDQRGERNLDEVMVYQSLPQELFTSFEPVDLSIYE